MMVDVIIHNVRDIDKIEMILFTKEIKPKEVYEFIDLKRYLDLANIAYALTTFERNYTVASNVKVEDKNFQKLLDDLSKFSQHILVKGTSKKGMKPFFPSQEYYFTPKVKTKIEIF